MGRGVWGGVCEEGCVGRVLWKGVMEGSQLNERGAVVGGT